MSDSSYKHVLADFRSACASDATIPPMESYLPRVDKMDRASCLLAMLEIELAARRSRGDSPTAGEYETRFPEYSDVIRRSFGSGSTSGMQTATYQADVDEFVCSDDSPQRQRAPFSIEGIEFVRSIGRGGMGEVFLVRQLDVNRIAALKILRMSHSETITVELYTRFQTEIEAMANCEHDNIVSVYGCGEYEGLPYYTMQYVEGETLADKLKETPLDGKIVARYLSEVADAMSLAHRRGILHRDIKPSNVLIDSSDDRALVADFGLAKVLTEQGNATETRGILGSAPYMSPEQCKTAAVDEAADIYSLGASLYHALTGRPPFQSSHPAETMRQINEDDPVPVRSLVPSVSRDLETITLKCLEKRPTDRYQSMNVVRDELDRFLSGRPIDARPVSLAGKVVKWASRNPWLAGATGLVAMLLVTVSAISSYAYFVVQSANQARSRTIEAATNAADSMITTIAQDKRLEDQGKQSLRRELLLRAADVLDELTIHDTSIRPRFASAMFQVSKLDEQLGDLAAAEQHALRAVEQLSDVISNQACEEDYHDASASYFQLARIAYGRGDLDSFEKHYAKGMHLLDGLLQVSPNREDTLSMYASALHNKGVVLFASKDASGIDYLREAVAKRRALVKATAQESNARNAMNLRAIPKTLKSIAMMCVDTGENEKALEAYEEAITEWGNVDEGVGLLRGDQLELALTLSAYAQHLSHIGQVQAATSRITEARKLIGDLVSQEPENVVFAVFDKHIELSWAEVLIRDSRGGQATAIIDGALQSLSTLKTRAPDLEQIEQSILYGEELRSQLDK